MVAILPYTKIGVQGLVFKDLIRNVDPSPPPTDSPKDKKRMLAILPYTKIGVQGVVFKDLIRNVDPPPPPTDSPKDTLIDRVTHFLDQRTKAHCN
jgi:hypothetical protein